MSVELRIAVDLAELRRLRDLKGKARTAGAKALTFTAKDAQSALKAQVPGTFHLRNAWVPKGIRITPASSGSMMAAVGSIDKYMDRHVIGAGRAKPPEKGLSVRSKRDSRGRLASGGLLIMPYDSIGEYPTHTAVSRRLRRVDGQKRKSFQIFGKGKAVVLIVRRKGKTWLGKGASRKRGPLETLAILRGSAVDIKESWDMAGTVRGVVASRFGHHFAAAIGKV